MSYINKVIQPGERIMFSGRIHWIVYLWPIFLILLGLGIIIYGPVMIINIDIQNNGGDPPFFLIIGGCLILLGSINLLSAIIYRITTEIAVTNRRVIFKKGFIWRKTMEMNIGKVESVSIDQTVMGRIFDFGTVAVIGTGSSIEPFVSVDNPVDLRNMIQTFDPQT